MKVTKKNAVAFLKSFGFKAEGWPDDKIRQMLLDAPQKVTEKEVPAEFKDLYTKLCGSCSTIEFTDKTGKTSAPAEKEVLREKKKKPAKVPAAPKKTDAVKTNKKGAKGRLSGLSEMVEASVKRGGQFEGVLKAVRQKYEGVSPSWLRRVYDSKKKKHAKAKKG